MKPPAGPWLLAVTPTVPGGHLVLFMAPTVPAVQSEAQVPTAGQRSAKNPEWTRYSLKTEDFGFSWPQCLPRPTRGDEAMWVVRATESRSESCLPGPHKGHFCHSWVLPARLLRALRAPPCVHKGRPRTAVHRSTGTGHGHGPVSRTRSQEGHHHGPSRSKAC